MVQISSISFGNNYGHIVISDWEITINWQKIDPDGINSDIKKITIKVNWEVISTFNDENMRNVEIEVEWWNIWVSNLSITANNPHTVYSENWGIKINGNVSGNVTTGNGGIKIEWSVWWNATTTNGMIKVWGQVKGKTNTGLTNFFNM